MPAKYARAYLTADQSKTVNSTYIISWNGTRADTDSFWSAGNPTRLTVPAGVTHVRLTGAHHLLPSTASVMRTTLKILKNGSVLSPEISESWWRDSTGYQNHARHVESPVLAVSPGDYFEMQVVQEGGPASCDLTADRNFFQIEAVDNFSGALVRLNATDTGLTLQSAHYVSWDAAVYDTHTLWSAGNPTRLTMPSSAAYAQFFTQIGFENFRESQSRVVGLRKNGTTGLYVFTEGRQDMPVVTFEQNLQLVTPIIPVIGGDYFEAYAISLNVASDQIRHEQSYFGARVWGP